MKAIELAIYTPEGQIKVDTGVYKTNIDKRLSLDKLVEQAKNKGREIGKRRVGKECRSRWSPYH